MWTTCVHYLLINLKCTVFSLALEVRLSAGEKQLDDLKTENTGNTLNISTNESDSNWKYFILAQTVHVVLPQTETPEDLVRFPEELLNHPFVFFWYEICASTIFNKQQMNKHTFKMLKVHLSAAAVVCYICIYNISKQLQ